MKRLTKKYGDNYDLYVKLPTIKKQAFLDKLGELEDIEQELGIDLITLFKALKNGICVKDYPEIKTVSLTLFFDGNKELWFQWLGNKRPYPTFYKVSDYGKTWVLDKKELNNDK